MNDNNYEDFSNTPKLINEYRAHKEGDCSKWSAREALITMLRDIDNGKINPEQLVITYTLNNEVYSVIANCSLHDVIGMLTRMIHFVVRNQDEHN